MATPWETMKQQPNGNTLGKQAKLCIAPQSFKCCEKTTNTITALSNSEPVNARSAELDKI
jgi:hypothetical protein